MQSMIRRAVLLGLLLALAACAPLKYRSAEPPRVTLSSLKLVELNVLEQRFEVGLRLQNPNDLPLPISGMEYTVVLDGEPFASGVNAEPIDLPAYGEAVVDVTVATNLLANLQQFRRWQSDPPDALDYQLKGQLSLKDMPLRMPFDYTGSVALTGVP